MRHGLMGFNIRATVREETPAVAVLPYGSWPRWGIAKTPLDSAIWPLGRPERLSHGSLTNLQADDHLITFPRTPVFYGPRFGLKAKVSVMIVEPDTVHAHHLRNAQRMRHRFWRILSKNRKLLSEIDNGEFFILGWAMVDAKTIQNHAKARQCSLIASARNDLQGHQLRHKLVDYIGRENIDVDIMGRGYKPFAQKEDGLLPYRYSVIIENSQETSYFTEKLIDCCLCRTVPIYWGAPDVAQYFDPEGMLICQTEAELQQALSNMSEADFEKRRDAIERNFVTACHYADWETRVADLVLRTGAHR